MTESGPADEEADSSAPEVKLLAAPEYGAAATAFFHNAIEFVARSVNPLYAVMTARTVRGEDVEGVTVEIAGTTVESPMVNVTYKVNIETDDIRATNFEALNTAIHDAAMSKLEQVSEAYNEYMDKATDAVGNNVQLSKEAYNWDTVLDLYKKVEWAEGTDGEVHPPGQLSGSGVPQLPDRTPEQERRYQHIYVAKQEEYVARRRSRRLR